MNNISVLMLAIAVNKRKRKRSIKGRGGEGGFLNLDLGNGFGHLEGKKIL